METYMCLYADHKFGIAEKLQQHCKYPEAIAKYSECISIMSENPLFYVQRAKSLMAIGEYENALKDAKQTVLLNQNFTESYLIMSKCYMAIGHASDAEEAFNNYIENNNNTLTQDTENLQRDLENLKQIITKFECLFQSDCYSKCVETIDEALTISGASTKLKLEKSKCFSLMARFDEAQAVVGEIIEKDVYNADAFYVKGLVYYYEDDLDKAIENFENALRNDQSHKGAKDMRKLSKLIKENKAIANKHFMNKRFPEALSIYEEILTNDLHNNNEIKSKLYFNCALVKFAMKQINEAICNCNKAIECNSRYTKALIKRAQLYNHINDYNKALSDCLLAYAIEQKAEIKTLFAEVVKKCEIDKNSRKRKREDFFQSDINNEEASMPIINSADLIKNKIKHFMLDGDYESAVSNLILLELFEHDNEYRLIMLVKCHTLLDNTVLAEQILNELVAGNEPSSFIFYELVELRLHITEIKKCYQNKSYNACLLHLDIMESMGLCLSEYYKILKAECLAMVSRETEGEKILSFVKKDAQAYYVLGLIFYQNNKLPKALIHLKSCLQKNKNHENAANLCNQIERLITLMTSIDCLANSKHNKEALELCAKLVKSAKDNKKLMHETQLKYSSLLCENNDYDRKNNSCHNPSNNKYFLNQIIHKINGHSLHNLIKESKAKEYIDLSQNHYESKDFGKAFASINLAIDLMPSELNYYYLRASCCYSMKKFKEAVKDAQTSVTSNSECMMKSQILLANCYLSLGEIENLSDLIECMKNNNYSDVQSLKLYEKFDNLQNDIYKAFNAYKNNQYSECLNKIESVVTQSSKCTMFNIIKAECLIWCGKTYNAQRIMNSIAESNEKWQDVLYLKGLISYLEDDLENAVSHLKNCQSISIKSKKILNNSMTILNRRQEGKVLLNAKNYDDALQIYSNTINIDKTNKVLVSNLYLSCADINYQLKYWKDGISDCNEALKCNAANNAAKTILYKCKQKLHEKEEAIRKINLIINLNTTISNNIKNDQYEQCIQNISKLIKLQPNNYEMYAKRAFCYIAQGKFSEALADAEQSVKLNRQYVDGIFYAAKCSMLLGDIAAENIWFEKLNIDTTYEKLSNLQKDEYKQLQDAKLAFETANCYFDNKQYKDCICYIDKGLLGIAANSDHYEFLRLECEIILGCKEAKVCNFLNNANVKNDPRVSYITGVVQYHNDQFSEAKASFESYQAYKGDCDKTHHYLVLCQQMIDIIDETKDCSSAEVSKIYSKYISDKKCLAIKIKLLYQQALSESKQFKISSKVIKLCTDALEINERYKNALKLRAEVYSKIGEHNKSTSDINTLTKIEDQSFESKPKMGYRENGYFLCLIN